MDIFINELSTIINMNKTNVILFSFFDIFENITVDILHRQRLAGSQPRKSVWTGW